MHRHFRQDRSGVLQYTPAEGAAWGLYASCWAALCGAISPCCAWFSCGDRPRLHRVGEDRAVMGADNGPRRRGIDHAGAREACRLLLWVVLLSALALAAWLFTSPGTLMEAVPEVAEVLPDEKDIPTIPKLFKSLDPVGSLMLNPEEFERGESCEGRCGSLTAKQVKRAASECAWRWRSSQSDPLLGLPANRTPAPAPLLAPKDAYEFVRRQVGSAASAPKVFVYKSTLNVNKLILKEYSERFLDPLSPYSQFAAEHIIHMNLVDSRYYTRKMSEADIFFVPFYGRMARAKDISDRLKAETVRMLRESKYWQRRGGRDHVFVLSGAQRHFGQGIFGRELWRMMQSGILLTVDSPRGNDLPREMTQFVVPYWVPPPGTRGPRGQVIPNATFAPREARNLDVWFEGTRTRSKANNLRNKILPCVFRSCERSLVTAHHTLADEKMVLETFDHMLRARFCLCPLGVTPGSRRLFESVSFNCVPTLISDSLRVPYEEWLDYSQMAVRIPEKCAQMTPQLLTEHYMERFEDYRAAVEAVRPLFLYRPMGPSLDHSAVRDAYRKEDEARLRESRPRELSAIDAVFATIKVALKI